MIRDVILYVVILLFIIPHGHMLLLYHTVHYACTVMDGGEAHLEPSVYRMLRTKVSWNVLSARKGKKGRSQCT